VVSYQHRYGEHYQKVKEIIASGAIGRVHTVYGHATGWMMHMMPHLIEYTSWYNDYSPAQWVVGQADGVEKFEDNHPSPDYITASIQFENGVRGIVECGAGAPDVPEVDYWCARPALVRKGRRLCRSADRRRLAGRHTRFEWGDLWPWHHGLCP